LAVAYLFIRALDGFSCQVFTPVMRVFLRLWQFGLSADTATQRHFRAGTNLINSPDGLQIFILSARVVLVIHL